MPRGMVVEDHVPGRSHLEKGGNGRVVASGQGVDLSKHPGLVGRSEEEDLVALRFLDSETQDLEDRVGAEIWKAGHGGSGGRGGRGPAGKDLIICRDFRCTIS